MLPDWPGTLVNIIGSANNQQPSEESCICFKVSCFLVGCLWRHREVLKGLVMGVRGLYTVPKPTV